MLFVNKFSPNLHVPNDPSMAYPLAKQKQLSFPHTTPLSNALFDLVHYDVWRPYSIPTVESYRFFFFTIVDDLSRATWVYLLKHKSEVPLIIKNFFKMIQTQFSLKINKFRTDHNIEFSLSSCFDSKGILQQHSYVETPRQNSIVVRKYQHILNIAQTLMFQSHLPIQF